MDLGVPLESPPGNQASSRVETCMSTFLPSCSSSVWLPLDLKQGSGAFPRGLPTELSHLPPWCQLKLRATVEAVQGSQVHLEWTETFEGRLVWWHDPWSSSQFSCGERLLLIFEWNARKPYGKKQGMEPTSRAEEGETGLLLSCGGTLGVPLEWLRVCWGTS